MAGCSAITQAGARCRGIAIDALGLCHAHHPDRAQTRKQAGHKGGKRGGRGRPVSELASIKRQLQDLADDVLAGEVKRAEAAVVGQLLNILLRAVEVERKAKEQEELLERIEALERAEGGYEWGV